MTQTRGLPTTEATLALHVLLFVCLFVYACVVCVNLCMHDFSVLLGVCLFL